MERQKTPVSAHSADGSGSSRSMKGREGRVGRSAGRTGRPASSSHRSRSRSRSKGRSRSRGRSDRRVSAPAGAGAGAGAGRSKTGAAAAAQRGDDGKTGESDVDRSWLLADVVDPKTGHTLRVPVASDMSLYAMALMEGFPFLNEARADMWVRNCDFVRAVVDADGLAMGGFGLIDQGIFFGGNSVRCMGVTAVAILSHCRGSGAGSALLRQCLLDSLAFGAPLAALHPTAQAFYQRFGFERASNMVEYRIATAQIEVPAAPPSEPRYRLRPFDPTKESNLEKIKSMYLASARTSNGMLDRGEYVWKRVVYENTREPEGKRRVHQAYVVERMPPAADDESGDHTQPTGSPTVEGYLFAKLLRSGRKFPEVSIRDVVCRSPGAWRAVARWMRGLRSTVEDVVWHGSASHPLCLLLGTQQPPLKVTISHTMSLRVLDLKAAIEARGYPRRVSAMISLEVRDPQLPHNDGRWLIEVAKGSATATPNAGDGTLQVDAVGLGPLYTGYCSPEELIAAGVMRLAPGVGEGEAAEALEDLADTFHRTSPGHVDMF